MSKYAKVFLTVALLVLMAFSLYGEAPLGLGFGFKASPRESAQLMIARYWFPNQFGVEAGISLWTNDAVVFSQHIEVLGLFRVLDLFPAMINLFAGVQLTSHSEGDPASFPGWFRFGMELEFYLVERVSILASGSFDISLKDPHPMGNSQEGLGTGFILYF